MKQKRRTIPERTARQKNRETSRQHAGDSLLDHMTGEQLDDAQNHHNGTGDEGIIGEVTELVADHQAVDQGD